MHQNKYKMSKPKEDIVFFHDSGFNKN